MHYVAATWHTVWCHCPQLLSQSRGFGNSEACNNEDSCDVAVNDQECGKLEGHGSFDDYVNIDENVVTTEADVVIRCYWRLLTAFRRK